MNRWRVFLAVVIVAGTTFVLGASALKEEEKPAKPTAANQKTAFFNIPAVMRDFNQAKYQDWRLNKIRLELVKPLLEWRSEYVSAKSELKINPMHLQKEE